jgi:hypothetical protein
MRRPGDSTLTRSLFPEEIVEGGAGVQTTAVYRPAGIVCLSLDRSPSDKKVAGVPDILLGDSFRDGLGALKLCARVEITAVLTRSQIGAAFGTGAFQTYLNGGRDDGAAHGAP